VAEVGSVGSAPAVVAVMMRYEVAPLIAVQLNRGAVLMLVAPLAGVSNVGLGNVESVVNCRELPVELPALLLASTL
jgi:hypothetical protein